MLFVSFNFFLYTTKGKKLINEVKEKKKKRRYYHSCIVPYTQTNKYTRAYVLLLFFVQYTFLKSAQKEKVNCILIIKATHT